MSTEQSSVENFLETDPADLQKLKIQRGIGEGGTLVSTFLARIPIMRNIGWDLDVRQFCASGNSVVLIAELYPYCCLLSGKNWLGWSLAVH